MIQYETRYIKLPDFQTQCGCLLISPNACYTIYGNIHSEKKIALLFHGLSLNSEILTWWHKFNFVEMLEEYTIICVNALGSCHGSTGPESVNPNTGTQYLSEFPKININDSVDFTISTLKALKINQVDLVFGCSLGGMQAIDMYSRYPTFARKYISIAGGELTNFAKLFNLIQIRIINSQLSEDSGRYAEYDGLARYIFRLLCSGEGGLNSQIEKNINFSNADYISIMDRYFVNDSLRFKNEFSYYSNRLLLNTLNLFTLDSTIINGEIHKNRLILGVIENDLFTSENKLLRFYENVKLKNCDVKLKIFKTNFGHEAWITDGEKFYEFIKKDIYF